MHLGPTPRAALLLFGSALALVPSCDCGGDDVDVFVPALRFVPARLDFGPHAVGSLDTRPLTLINEGNAPVELLGPLAIEGEGRAAFTLVEADVFPLAGGAFADVVVRFAPGSEGDHAGTLVLPLAPPLERTLVPLAGEGVPAEIDLSPASLDFGAVEAGESAQAAVTVTSRAAERLTVRLALQGEGFLLEGAALADVTLEPAASADVEVTFLPARGGPFSGRLVAEMCGPGCGPSVDLVGEGLAPRIAIAPRPLDLGEVAVGESASATLTLSNAGVGNLSISSLAVLDGEARITVEGAPELPLVLAGGEAAEVTVRYAAAEPDAAVQASLVVESNDPLSPRVNVPIFASTAGAALRVVPSAAHFGVLDPGESRALDVVALSRGTVPVTLTNVELLGADASSFSVVTPLPSLPLSLAPGESWILTVAAAPDESDAASGGASASLVLETLEAGEESAALTFASGSEGCQPRARAASLNLGAVRVGLGASGMIEVENVGTATCTFASLRPASGLTFDAGFTWSTSALATIAPGQSGQLLIAYQASSPGTATAFFELAFAEQPAPVLVSATAWAVLGALVAEPPTVFFGPNVEGCPAHRGVVVYVNDGAGPVTVTDVVLDPETAPFTLGPTGTPRVVPAGGSLEVGVTPMTTAAGTFQARLIAVTEESGDVAASMTSLVEPAGALLTETFLVDDAVQAIDVLFIVDNSGSMEDDQERLATNFAEFVAAAEDQAAEIDFHLGVTTTDVISAGAARGRLVGTPRVMTPETPSLEQVFAEHARVGVSGFGLELGLEAMRLALSEPTLSGANAGFHRPEAALSIIVVADEDDSGDYADLTDYYPEGVRSIEGYIAFLAAVKGGSLSNVPVLFSSVTGYAPRYHALVDAFGGVKLDITDPAWGSQLGLLGQATFGLGRTFRLGAAPQQGSVSVVVDGVATTAFSVDYTSGSVLLDEPPPPGAVVEVSYVAECS